MLLNIHRINTRNVGDLECTPVKYFSNLKDCEELDPLGYTQGEAKSFGEEGKWTDKISTADGIIVGGGGLIGNDFFSQHLNKVFSTKNARCKTVLWGAGHNKWQLDDWRDIKYNIELEELPYDLIGVRDYNQKYEWVPCVSCLSSLFDILPTFVVERDVGLYVHADTLLNDDLSKRLPKNIEILNNDETFEAVLKYLATSDLILTDSYHGAYWGTLLGKKVVAFPSSSKFYDMRHAVPLCAPEDWERFRKLSITYPEALAECRTANLSFASKVENLLNISLLPPP